MQNDRGKVKNRYYMSKEHCKADRKSSRILVRWFIAGKWSAPVESRQISTRDNKRHRLCHSASERLQRKSCFRIRSLGSLYFEKCRYNKSERCFYQMKSNSVIQGSALSDLCLNWRCLGLTTLLIVWHAGCLRNATSWDAKTSTNLH